MLLFSRKAPVISSIEPAMAAPGEVVTLTGDYFGRTAREGQLMLSGLTPPPSDIVEWGDQKIVFQVPVDAPSGLVTVSNTQGTSSSVLFTNTLTIPTVLKTRAESVPLEITYGLPSQPLAGSLVSLGGRGFGRGESGSWLEFAANNGGPVHRLLPLQTEQWSDQMIRFVLPAGLGGDATVSVHLLQGQSTAYALQAVSPLSYEQPRTVSLEFPVTVPYVSGTGSLVIFSPLPGAEVGLEVQGSPDENLRWTSVSASTEATWKVTVTTLAHRWTGWPAGQVIPLELQTSPVAEPLPAVPWKAQTAALKALASGWGLDFPDQFLRAKRLAAGLRLSFHRGATSLETQNSGASLLASRRLNPWEAATLMAFWGRQSGLGTRLVNGLLLGDGTVRPHAWVQVWIGGAGWLDVDPWQLLDSEEGILDQEFGSLDSRHLAWAVAAAHPPRREPKSRTVSGRVDFASQTLLAEVTGTLEILPPEWGSPRVVSSGRSP